MGIRLSSILIGGMLCILSTSLIAGPNSGTESAAGAAVHAAANRRADARYYATMVQGTATMRAYFEHLQREIPVDASGDTEARLRLRLASYLTSSPKQSHELAAILLSLGQAERETQFWLLHVFFVQAAGAQDLSAMAEIAKTMLKDFPSAEAGLRMTLTQAILAEDWKGSAEALIALLGDGTWSKASGTSFGYSKGLRLPKDADTSEQTTWRSAWRPMLRRADAPLASRARFLSVSTNRKGWNIDYALPELDVWAMAACRDSGIISHLEGLERTSDFPDIVKRLRLRVALERAIASEATGEAKARLVKAAAQAYFEEEGLEIPDVDQAPIRFGTVHQAWVYFRAAPHWMLRGGDNKPTEMVAALDLIVKEYGEIPSNSASRGREDLFSNYGLPSDLAGTIKQMVIRALSVCEDDRGFVALSALLGSPIRRAFGSQGRGDLEYQSTLLAIALRRIAHEAPSRYLHFVSQSDLRVSRAAMAILPHSGGEPVTWLQSLIVSYAEARTLLLAEFLSPFNNRGASVNQEALRQSLFHAMEFKTMQSDALEAGVPIDLGVLTKDFESALLDLAERFPDDALVWLREVLRGPKREQLDPNGAGQSYAKQVFGDIALFRIAQRLQQILVDQGVSEALEIEVSSPHRGPVIPSIKEALAFAEQLTKDSDSEEVKKIFEAIVPESEESLRQSPSHVGPSFMIRVAIALHALDRYELRGHLDEEVQAFALDSKSLLFSPFHPTTLKAAEVVILNAAQNKKVQKAIMQQFLRLVMDAEAAKPNFLAEADWFYDFGYPLKIREWFEADDKDLQRFRRLIEGQNLEGLRPVAPFSSRANSQAWTLHLAGTLPELGKRLAQFELTLGSVPNRATFVEGRAEAQVQSLFVQLGSSVTIAGAGAVTDTLAWSHFDGGSKEGALASQEWALKLAPGHLGFRAAIRHFHGAEAPHTVPNTSEAEPRETQPKETTPIEAKPIEPKPIKNDAETKPEEAKKDPPKEREPKRPDPSKRFWRKS